MLITIFTPLYNRAHLLQRLYDSLLIEKSILFEWIIVDDGSTDNAQEVINEFIKEAKINIKYVFQQNKGKHIAINNGVHNASGKFFWIVDSDDYLPPHAMQTVIEKYETVKNIPNIAVIIGRRNYNDGKIIGDHFEEDLLTTMVDYRFHRKMKGDLSEVVVTDVLRKFPFPDIPQEKFCSESLLWNRLSQNHLMLFFNIGIYTSEYLPDGLTAKITKIRMNSPIYSMMAYSERLHFDIPFLEKIKATANFWRFSFHSSKPFKEKLQMIPILPSLIGFPLGFILFVKDTTAKKNN